MFMNYIGQRKVVQLFYFILLLILFLLIAQTGKAKEAHIIAVVEGISITDEDVSVNRDTEYQAFKQKNKKEPNTEELSIVILEAKQRKLIGKINEVLRETALKKFGITISTGEARTEFINLYPGLKEKPGEVLDRERAYFQKLFLALRDAMNHPEKEREIFKLKIEGLIENETWKGMLRYYNTPEKLEMFKKMIPESIEDIYISGELGMKDWVLNKKLEDVVAKDVEVTDEEIKEYFESQFAGRKTKPQFKEIKTNLQQELLKIKRRQRVNAWWQEQYKKAKIEIKDERFKDVLKKMIPVRKEK